ncbi:2-oxo acid dehydrogenase subunit E2 [Candidatus Sumerlaeota bacterium]|nr:2-oxo acid dehydrogenase subunit E2 [Candidatus Sumerlaeota bacterium]
MAKPITLVQLSPTMSEGTLVKWLVKEGDRISNGQAIAEVETDKAVMEQESFFDGTLLKIVAKEGSKVAVEGTIAIVGEPGEDISALGGNGTTPSATAAEKSAPAKAQPAPAAAQKPASAPAPVAKPAGSRVPPAPAKATTPPVGERTLASPLARKIAKDAGVELRGIAGSGPQGRVVRKDVENAVANGGNKAVASPARNVQPVAVSPLADEEVKLSGMRQVIARRLLESKQTVPHFQLSIDVRGEGLLTAVARIKEAMPDAKVTVTHLIIKAMGAVALRHKAIRSQWADDHLNVLGRTDISVAVAIEDGLLTPVLRDVHAKGVLQLAQELRDVAGKARARKLTPEDMSGGIQTLSNLGMYGINQFAAIINPPESSILAVAAMEDRPVVEDGRIVPGKVMTITMGCDHRVIDGAVAAQYLQDLKATLENPVMMLL